MAKINYVMTHKTDYSAHGVVQYVNGTRREYDLVTSKFPNTVEQFCITAKNVTTDIILMENGSFLTVKTYGNY
jgi:hypothetical protein